MVQNGFSPKTRPMELKLRGQKRGSVKSVLIDAKLQGASCVGRATTVSEVDIGIDAGHTATRWLKALLG